MTVLCAECGRSVAPDTDHVRVELEKKRMDDPDDLEEYYLHVGCALDLTEDWTKP